MRAGHALPCLRLCTPSFGRDDFRLGPGDRAVVVPAGDLALSLLVEQLREGLRESERRMATLVANLPGMAYRCGNDPDWTMEFISQGCTALTGYPPSVLLGNAVLSYNDLVLSEERKWLWDQVQSALARREPFQVVYHIRAADGVVKTVWEQGRGVLGEAGELVALEGFITDVTERADSEDALRTGEEKLRAVVTASPLAVVFIDSDEIARLFNPAAEQVFGWKAVVVLGHPWPAVPPGREEEAQALSRR